MNENSNYGCCNNGNTNKLGIFFLIIGVIALIVGLYKAFTYESPFGPGVGEESMRGYIALISLTITGIFILMWKKSEQ